MNPRLINVQESATLRIADKARVMQRQGRDVVKLQTGDPDFATPSAIIESAYRAMQSGFTHYGPTRGLPELRQAVAEKLHRDNGLTANPETEILITHGAAHGLFAAFQTLLSPGDEVLLLEPYYMSYASSVRLAGGVPVPVRSDPKGEFRVDPADVRRRITSRTRILVLNSPCNPSGTVLSSSQLRELCAIAVDANLMVVTDDVYEKLIYDGAVHHSVATLPGMAERTVTINSFSKTYAMTGWRIGYAFAPPAVTAEMLKIVQYSATNIALFVQYAGLTALTEPELRVQVEAMRLEYTRRRSLALEAASNSANLAALPPDGAFYLMLDVSRAGMDSVSFSTRLLDEAGVAVVPGVAFGESAEGWIRASFSVPAHDIVEGIQRMDHFIGSQRL